VFLGAICDSRLPSHRPVIVLSNHEPPDELIQEFSKHRTVFLHGPVTDVVNLREAGLGDARSVVMFRDHQQEKSVSVLDDHNTLYHACRIDSLLMAFENNPSTMTDLISSESLSLLHFAATKMDRAHLQKSIKLHVGANKPLKASSLSSIALNWMPPTSGLDARDVLLKHPLFVSGQAFTADFFGDMLAKMYVFPAVIELVEAFCMPTERNQDSVVWQVACPEKWKGRTFEDLQHCWLQGEDPDLSGCGCGIVLSIFREASPNRRDAHGYNIILPEPSMILFNGDRLSVIAGTAFGKRMNGRQLLTGVDHNDT